jgi:hypothetical protein
MEQGSLTIDLELDILRVHGDARFRQGPWSDHCKPRCQWMSRKTTGKGITANNNYALAAA